MTMMSKLLDIPVYSGNLVQCDRLGWRRARREFGPKFFCCSRNILRAFGDTSGYKLLGATVEYQLISNL